MFSQSWDTKEWKDPLYKSVKANMETHKVAHIQALNYQEVYRNFE
jgi:hypothetical protein